MKRNSKISTRRIIATLGVVLASAVCVRLGFWQLDRLAQRRAYNATLSARISQPAVDLSQISSPDPASLEYRTVTVTGQYDFADQIALRNTVQEGQLGVDLLTPLIVQGTNQAVLVDRGWIPVSDLHRDAWGKYDQPGTVTVRGMLRQGQGGSGGVVPVTGAAIGRVDLWSSVALAGIQKQVAKPLEPFFIQAAPDSANPALPARQAPQLDLSNGPHLGYAIQWFSFAGILLIGYLFLVRRQTRRKNTATSTPGGDGELGPVTSGPATKK